MIKLIALLILFTFSQLSFSSDWQIILIKGEPSSDNGFVALLDKDSIEKIGDKIKVEDGIKLNKTVTRQDGVEFNQIRTITYYNCAVKTKSTILFGFFLNGSFINSDESANDDGFIPVKKGSVSSAVMDYVCKDI